jgi:hypothetical protein
VSLENGNAMPARVQCSGGRDSAETATDDEDARCARTGHASRLARIIVVIV